MESRTPRIVAVLLAAAVLAVGGTARAGDEAKAECKRGCEEALSGCKSDCQSQRGSGTLEESSLYAGCDSGCHDTYQSCKSDCERQ